ncbi:YbaB/EbfC family nucleoid-associated protein [Glycomyces dulcitolivorans]|uniref:YbaB/EbfC family nucleoid-associated protein n=1 Tax=Glycomyces dulcitolivorans TaxID=2200759 RepID=UPI0013002DD1|nr:YbaB/EbfC family nucleoid-associated protein [Glycomyces dulcitolivorans]
MRTPEEIMQDLESRVAVIQERAGRAEELLAESEVTLADEDEIVTVTVNAGGNLTGLRFSPQARGLSGTGLADLVLEVYRLALEESGRKTTEIMSTLLGEDSEAMSVITGFAAPRTEEP